MKLPDWLNKLLGRAKEEAYVSGAIALLEKERAQSIADGDEDSTAKLDRALAEIRTLDVTK